MEFIMRETSKMIHYRVKALYSMEKVDQLMSENGSTTNFMELVLYTMNFPLLSSETSTIGISMLYVTAGLNMRVFFTIFR